MYVWHVASTTGPWESRAPTVLRSHFTSAFDEKRKMRTNLHSKHSIGWKIEKLLPYATIVRRINIYLVQYQVLVHTNKYTMFRNIIVDCTTTSWFMISTEDPSNMIQPRSSPPESMDEDEITVTSGSRTSENGPAEAEIFVRFLGSTTNNEHDHLLDVLREKALKHRQSYIIRRKKDSLVVFIQERI